MHPRHFVEDADAAGIPRGTSETLFEEIVAAAPAAIETAMAAVRSDWPPALAETIVAGFERRLRLLR